MDCRRTADAESVRVERKPVRMLIVEHDELLRETLAGLLEYEGYSVRTAPDARLAIAILGIERPDVLLADLDVAMTPSDLRRVRLLLGPVSIPIVGMTSRQGALEQDPGVSVLLEKPFDLDQLLDKIEPRLAVTFAAKHPG